MDKNKIRINKNAIKMNKKTLKINKKGLNKWKWDKNKIKPCWKVNKLRKWLSFDQNDEKNC